MKKDLIVPGGYWPLQDVEEKRRLNRYKTNYLLFRNKYEEVWPNWHDRVTKNWHKEDLRIALVVANFCKVLTLLCADLLCGEQGNNFGASCVDEKANEGLQEILTANHLNITAYEVSGIAASMRGDGLYKVKVEGGKVRIYPQPATNWFPLVEQDNVKKVIKHILAWEEEHNGKKYLRKETHERGQVISEIFALDDKEGKILNNVDLKTLDIKVPETEETRIDDFLIVHNPNWTIDSELYGVDDYEDIDTLVYELCIMLSRNSMVLAKHTDPNMCGDPSCLQQDDDGNYVLPIGGTFFPYQQGGAKPEYLTWDGKLEAAEKHIDRLLELLFYISETSPAAFGLDKHAIAESGAALKKRLIRTLAKVNRKKLYADMAIKKALWIAQMLDVEFCGAKYEPEVPNIDWQDGLPDDEMEQATIVGRRVEDGTLSQRSAIMRLDKVDEEAALKELEIIRQERNAALPAFARAGEIGFPENPFRQAGTAGTEGTGGAEGGGQ